MQALCLIGGAFIQAVPCAGRPHLPDHQRRDVVKALGRIFGIVLTGGAFGDGGEHLNSDIAGDQAGQVNLPTIRLLGQVTVPKQAIGVPIPDGQSGMQRCGLGADGEGIMRHNAVTAAFDIAGQKSEKDDGRKADQTAKGDQQFFEHVGFLLGSKRKCPNSGLANETRRKAQKTAVDSLHCYRQARIVPAGKYGATNA